MCPLPPIVVTEFCSRGSLTDVLRAAQASRSKGAQLDWARRISMVREGAGVAVQGTAVYFCTSTCRAHHIEAQHLAAEPAC